MQKEPLAANLHPFALGVRRPQEWLVRLMRRYFERASDWVFLTTTGRKTGLPREVLLPCAYFADGERSFRSIVIGRFTHRERSGATLFSL